MEHLPNPLDYLFHIFIRYRANGKPHSWLRQIATAWRLPVGATVRRPRPQHRAALRRRGVPLNSCQSRSGAE